MAAGWVAGFISVHGEGRKREKGMKEGDKCASEVNGKEERESMVCVMIK